MKLSRKNAVYIPPVLIMTIANIGNFLAFGEDYQIGLGWIFGGVLVTAMAITSAIVISRAATFVSALVLIVVTTIAFMLACIPVIFHVGKFDTGNFGLGLSAASATGFLWLPIANSISGFVLSLANTQKYQYKSRFHVLHLLFIAGSLTFAAFLYWIGATWNFNI